MADERLFMRSLRYNEESGMLIGIIDIVESHLMFTD